MINISIPPSKSYTHRLLISAALSDKKSKIKCDVLNDDVIATMNALNSIGANIKYEHPYFDIIPINELKFNNTINCNESGSTLRFIISICCALGLNNRFTGLGELPKRPMDQLYKLLTSHGINIVKENNLYLPIKCNGKLKPGKYELQGNISSQYLTGLLFALPLLENDSEIHIDGILTSKLYIDITLDVLKISGININVIDNVYYIKGNQKYNFPEYYEVEGDWSSAAFWICAGIIGDVSTCIEGLNINSKQGDKEIITLLKKLGANIEIKDNKVYSYPSKLIGNIELDCIDVPDIVPILSLCCAKCDGKVKLKNVGRLRFKESNRLTAIRDLLMNVNIICEIKANDLIVHGNKNIIGPDNMYINTYNDHRIAMTAYILGLLLPNTTIEYSNIKCINKSYNNFLSEYNKWKP